MLSKSDQDGQEYLAEINVTPLVDVVLVLLIIFMISAPLLMNDIALQLPKTKKVQALSQSKKSITLSLDKNGQLFLNQNKVSSDHLQGILAAKAKEKPAPIVYLRADSKTDYHFVAKVLAQLKLLKLTQISLVTETEDQ